jgi:hypothetical protein
MDRIAQRSETAHRRTLAAVENERLSAADRELDGVANFEEMKAALNRFR